MTVDDGPVEFTWERIDQFAMNPSLSSNYNPVKFRTDEVYRRYLREGSTLRLD